jgi:hypothetical protein
LSAEQEDANLAERSFASIVGNSVPEGTKTVKTYSQCETTKTAELFGETFQKSTFIFLSKYPYMSDEEKLVDPSGTNC